MALGWAGRFQYIMIDRLNRPSDSICTYDLPMSTEFIPSEVPSIDLGTVSVGTYLSKRTCL